MRQVKGAGVEVRSHPKAPDPPGEPSMKELGGEWKETPERQRERETERERERERDIHREIQRQRETERQRQRDTERWGKSRDWEEAAGRRARGREGAGGGCCACLPSSETHQGKSTGIYSGNHRLLALLFYHFADAITEPYPLSGKLEMSFPE